MTPQNKYSETDDITVYDNEIEIQHLIKESNFLLLNVLTFGYYSFWWTYKTWRFFLQKEGSYDNAAIRTFLYFIYMLPLLNRINRFANQEGYKYKFYPVLIFISLLSTSILNFLPRPYLLLIVVTTSILVIPLKAFNYAIQQSPGISSIIKEKLNTRQIVLVVIGSIVWLFVLIGLMLLAKDDTILINF